MLLPKETVGGLGQMSLISEFLNTKALVTIGLIAAAIIFLSSRSE